VNYSILKLKKLMDQIIIKDLMDGDHLKDLMDHLVIRIEDHSIEGMNLIHLKEGIMILLVMIDSMILDHQENLMTEEVVMTDLMIGVIILMTDHPVKIGTGTDLMIGHLEILIMKGGMTDLMILDHVMHHETRMAIGLRTIVMILSEENHVAGIIKEEMIDSKILEKEVLLEGILLPNL